MLIVFQREYNLVWYTKSFLAYKLTWYGGIGKPGDSTLPPATVRCDSVVSKKS